MGTSHAAKAPTTVKWARVIGSLKSPDLTASTVVRATLYAAVNWIPPGHIAIPVTAAAIKCVRFAIEVKEKGLESVAREEIKHFPEQFVAFGISESLWRIATSNVPQEFVDTPYGKLAETAFKKTISSIMIKGAKAMEENT